MGKNKNSPIYVARSSLPPLNEYIKEIQPIWESACLTNMGPIHQNFERKLISYLDVPNVSLFANGHLALETAIHSLDLKGEVITTPFTFASTTHAIVRNGLTPVFCDINPYNYTIDAQKIEELITEKTSAIIPVHVYGNICDVDSINSIAKKYNLKVIYDAAHAFGESVNGKGVGNFGDISMFSFHATKVFNSIEGGALTFSNLENKNIFNRLKNFGLDGPESVTQVGFNAKMNEFQAAMGICNLRHIDEHIAIRKGLVHRYREHLNHKSGINILGEQEGIVLNYAYFPVVFEETLCGVTRDEIFERLKKEGVFSKRYFYPLTCDYECYKGMNNNPTPIAKYISKRVLCLPIYADLKINEVDRICRLILEV